MKGVGCLQSDNLIFNLVICARCHVAEMLTDILQISFLLLYMQVLCILPLVRCQWVIIGWY